MQRLPDYLTAIGNLLNGAYNSTLGRWENATELSRIEAEMLRCQEQLTSMETNRHNQICLANPCDLTRFKEDLEYFKEEKARLVEWRKANKIPLELRFGLF